MLVVFLGRKKKRVCIYIQLYARIKWTMILYPVSIRIEHEKLKKIICKHKNGSKIIIWHLQSERSVVIFVISVISEFKISITATEHALMSSSKRIEMKTLWTHAFLGTHGATKGQNEKSSSSNNNRNMIFMCYNNIYFQCVDIVGLKGIRMKKKNPKKKQQIFLSFSVWHKYLGIPICSYSTCEYA